MRGFRGLPLRGAAGPSCSTYAFIANSSLGRGRVRIRRELSHAADGERPPFVSAGPEIHLQKACALGYCAVMNITFPASSDGPIKVVFELPRHRIDPTDICQHRPLSARRNVCRLCALQALLGANA